MSFGLQHTGRLLLCTLLSLISAGSAFCAGIPEFVNESVYTSNRATVATVDSDFAADVVILDGGLQQGFRRGMVCLVERDSEFLGELIIVDAKSNASAALIIDLVENLTIRSGDSVRIKTLQNS